MGIEDDFDHLAKRILETTRAAQAGQPDTLVFCLRETEIRELLLGLAESADREAETMTLPPNVTAIRRARPRPMVTQVPPGYPELPSVEEMEAAQAARLRQIAEELRANAKTYRFLAAHVEEERFFRLGTHDLSFLGLVPSPVSHLHLGAPMPLLVPQGG
jgi:hypothetical protein